MNKRDSLNTDEMFWRLISHFDMTKGARAVQQVIDKLNRENDTEQYDDVIRELNQVYTVIWGCGEITALREPIERAKQFSHGIRQIEMCEGITILPNYEL